VHIQLFHCTEFAIESLEESNRPKGICSVKSVNSKKIYKECLAVFTTVEKGDCDRNITNAIEEISKVYDRLRGKKVKANCNELVVVPYAHQRNVETNGKAAFGILNSVYEGLKNHYGHSVVFIGDFGFSNKWSIEVKSHKLSCLYREA